MNPVVGARPQTLPARRMSRYWKTQVPRQEGRLLQTIQRPHANLWITMMTANCPSVETLSNLSHFCQHQHHLSHQLDHPAPVTPSAVTPCIAILSKPQTCYRIVRSTSLGPRSSFLEANLPSSILPERMGKRNAKSQRRLVWIIKISCHSQVYQLSNRRKFVLATASWPRSTLPRAMQTPSKLKNSRRSSSPNSGIRSIVRIPRA